MCLLAMAPAGKSMTDEQIADAWTSNPDGGGFAYIGKGGRIRVFRTMNLKAFRDAYSQAVKRHPDTPFLIHFRFATHGTTCLSNVHPFEVPDTDGNLFMGHNGVLPVKTHDDGRSDTKTFVQDWLTELPADWLDNPVLPILVEEFIGSGNKLVFLSTDSRLEKQWYILNEGDGHWHDDGVWFSNASYKPYHRVWSGNVVVSGKKGDAADDYEHWWRRQTELEPKCELCSNDLDFDMDRGAAQVCWECEVCWECGEFFDYCTCDDAVLMPLPEEAR